MVLNIQTSEALWELSDSDTERKFVRLRIAFVIGVTCFLYRDAGTYSRLSAVQLLMFVDAIKLKLKEEKKHDEIKFSVLINIEYV